jgi:hypothetical protein
MFGETKLKAQKDEKENFCMLAMLIGSQGSGRAKFLI